MTKLGVQAFGAVLLVWLGLVSGVLVCRSSHAFVAFIVRQEQYLVYWHHAGTHKPAYAGLVHQSGCCCFCCCNSRLLLQAVVVVAALSPGCQFI